MKKLITIAFVVLMSQSSFAQIWFHHTLDQSRIRSYGFNLVTGPDGSTVPVDLCVKRSGVVTVSGGKINVDLWSINDAIPCPNGISGSTKIIRDLRIESNRSTYGDPTRVLVLPFQAVNFGVNTIPFRMRKKVTVEESRTEIPSTGAASFSLALNVGYTYGLSQITTRAITNWSATLGVYAGPSTAELKKETVHHPSSWTTNQTNATLTYGVNLILARNSIGLVFAYGWENALGKNKSEWVYNKKPYFGFGINTSFMK